MTNESSTLNIVDRLCCSCRLSFKTERSQFTHSLFTPTSVTNVGRSPFRSFVPGLAARIAAPGEVNMNCIAEMFTRMKASSPQIKSL